jgi:hypothetical protein
MIDENFKFFESKFFKIVFISTDNEKNEYDLSMNLEKLKEESLNFEVFNQQAKLFNDSNQAIRNNSNIIIGYEIFILDSKGNIVKEKVLDLN